MKSQVNTALIAAASILTVIGVFSFSIAYQSETVVRSVKERTVINTINQIEFLKRALHKAVDYSVYQAAYEISKYGGYSGNCDPAKIDNIPFWRVGNVVCFPGNFYNLLNEKISDKLNSYIDSLDFKLDDRFHIPISGTVQANVSENYINTSFTTQDKITFRSELAEISDSGNIRENTSIKLGKILNIAKEKFVNSDVMQVSVVEADSSMNNVDINGVEKDCKQINIGDVCEWNFPHTPQSVISILEQRCGNQIEDIFRDRVFSQIESREFDNSDARLEIDVNSYVGYLSGSCSGTRTGTTSCGCAFSVCSSYGCPWDPLPPPCGSWTYIRNENVCVSPRIEDGRIIGECSRRAAECTSWLCGRYFDIYQNTVCSYNYDATVTAFVKISSKERYPIYDENERSVNMRNLELRFYSANKQPPPLFSELLPPPQFSTS
ncbi:MAG: hypothetical protein KQA38_02745 [Candidatus Aenigmarchaeota archaeon]|nr:hypothetical protein [Candidatus Aenigmarchaeota archaeon]